MICFRVLLELQFSMVGLRRAAELTGPAQNDTVGHCIYRTVLNCETGRREDNPSHTFRV